MLKRVRAPGSPRLPAGPTGHFQLVTKIATDVKEAKDRMPMTMTEDARNKTDVMEAQGSKMSETIRGDSRGIIGFPRIYLLTAKNCAFRKLQLRLCSTMRLTGTSTGFGTW